MRPRTALLGRHSVRHSAKLPLFTERDWQAFVRLSASYLATALVPRRYDTRAIPLIAALLARLMPGRIKRRAEEMLVAFGEGAVPNARYDDAREYARQRFEDRWLRGRYQHRKAPTLAASVIGLEHHQRALDRGRGVILWRGRFCDAPAVNHVLWEAGIRAVHLSLDRHGVGRSRVGISLVGPWWAWPEARWLERRILIPSSGELGYLREVLELLGRNGSFSLFAEGVPDSRAPIKSTVLGRETVFPSGAASISHRTGATLLPLFAANPEPLRYEVVIEPPIEVDRGLDRREYARLVVEEFANRLEKAVLRAPAGWTGWREYTDEESS